jgi:pimeloyl-ACP methyl ester carboxylesterase
MFKYTLITLSLVILLVALAAPLAAQDSRIEPPIIQTTPTTPPEGDDLPEPQRIEVAASDGLTLIGHYYASPEVAVGDTGAPAVLLLHQNRSSKESWSPLLPYLYNAGYASLAVDMRGFGETGGAMDWPLAEQDMFTWVNWLREQPGVDPERVSLIGASIGANLALRGMAADERVVTAVALSPGLNYFDMTTPDAITAIGDRPVYLVASHSDAPSGSDTKQLAALAAGQLLVRLYPGSTHGTNLFMVQDDLIPTITAWLDVHNR